MSFMRLRILLFWWALAGTAFSQTTNGIYADFTTSQGNFSCRLEYTLAPKTVANFIGLATGGRAWIDPQLGGLRSVPFYDGITFHRVIAGFMAQSGSRNGQGTDGPGYAIRDEFHASLLHNAAGVLSMANSGPNSGGSQFFITFAPQPHLDGVHSVFGRITSGQSVAMSLTNGARLQKVSIRRVGTEALAFNIHAQNLPIVTNGPVTLLFQGTNSKSVFTQPLCAHSRFSWSSNLVTWSSTNLGIELSAPVAHPPQIRPLAPSGEFFTMLNVLYPESTLAPRHVLGRTLQFSMIGVGTMTLVCHTNGGGTYSLPPVAPGAADYSWSQEPYRAFFFGVFSGFPPMQLRLDFGNSEGGYLSGQIYTNWPDRVRYYPASGTFYLK